MKGEENESGLREEKTKKRKKKNSGKKRRRTSSTEDLVLGHDETPRKKNKTNHNSGISKEEEEPQLDESLEGALVNGEMILIDRISGKVYSGLERTENGDRKEIGRVSRSGSIILDKPDKGKNRPTCCPFLVRMYRSRLGCF